MWISFILQLYFLLELIVKLNKIQVIQLIYFCLLLLLFFAFLSRHQQFDFNIYVNSNNLALNRQEIQQMEKEKDKKKIRYIEKEVKIRRQLQEQNKLREQLQGLSIQEKKDNRFSQTHKNNKNNSEKEHEQNFLKQQFKKLAFQEKKSSINVVTFQSYKFIIEIWEKPTKDALQVLKQTKKIRSLSNLTVDTLCKLKHKKWLNDQVINAYIQLLNLQIQAFNNSKTSQKQQNNKKLNIKVVNTFFAPLLSNQKHKIQRIINKNLLNSSQTIIIPINQDNMHWFFVIVQKGHLHIFDSLSQKRTLAKYKINQIILNIINFMKWFYKQEKILKNLSNFPQQSNNYDCGVMMLSGIHAFVQHQINKFKIIQLKKQDKDKDKQKENKESSSINLLTFKFEQKDSLSKRFQFAIQIFNQKIQSFQW